MEHCPTKNMIADFFSKPTQGSLFREQRKTILNLESDEIAAYEPDGYKPLRSQECVREKSQRDNTGWKSNSEKAEGGGNDV